MYYAALPVLAYFVYLLYNLILDALRAFVSGAYGAKTSFTPQLDRLAAEGVRVSDFYANSCQTVRGSSVSWANRLSGLASGARAPTIWLRSGWVTEMV